MARRRLKDAEAIEIIGKEEIASSPVELLFNPFEQDFRQLSSAPVDRELHEPGDATIERPRHGRQLAPTGRSINPQQQQQQKTHHRQQHLHQQQTDQDCAEDIDGLVLMNSTRLRPAAKSSQSDESFIKLYMRTYRSLFARADSTTAVISLALHGNLANNPFRSLCWRLLLNVLPCNETEWVDCLANSRTIYKSLQEKHLESSRLQDPTIDLTINNPLSQAKDSPWNQHFQDSELKRIIEQDVDRTSPEQDFFQCSQVRRSMSNILFVFAKAHPDISYKQGMHELLAPLYFVTNSDLASFDHALALATSSPEAEAFNRLIPPEIFNASFQESDVYWLFESLMECVGDWFKPSNSQASCGSRERRCSRTSLDKDRPWSRPADNRGNAIVEKLSYIQDSLLKRHDPDLFARLEKLEIYPQLYGIRWLRLLFGREFHFLDTLCLWDAIFADSCPPGLVDQIMVALLMSVRDLLLVYDYTDAVSLLMKLPSNINVAYIVAAALHLKDPLRFPRQAGSPFDSGTRQVSSENIVGQKRGHSAGARQQDRLQQPRQQQHQQNRLHHHHYHPLSSSPVRKEITKVDQTFALKNPQDLPDFTVVDLNTRAGCNELVRGGELKRVTQATATAHSTVNSRPSLNPAAAAAVNLAPTPPANRGPSAGGGGAASSVNSLYLSKLQLIKTVDTLRDLLKSERLENRTRIMSSLDNLQHLCEELDSSSGNTSQPNPSPRQPMQAQPSSSKGSVTGRTPSSSSRDKDQRIVAKAEAGDVVVAGGREPAKEECEEGGFEVVRPRILRMPSLAHDIVATIGEP